MILQVGDERVLNFNEGDSLELFCHGGSDESVYISEQLNFYEFIS